MTAMDAGSGGPGGRWTHSFEEDEADVQVFRPTDSFAFPPARRGRESLEFGGAGQVLTGMPGPDDRRRSSSTSLTPLGMNRFSLGGSNVIEIVEQGPDLLKIRFV